MEHSTIAYFIGLGMGGIFGTLLGMVITSVYVIRKESEKREVKKVGNHKDWEDKLTIEEGFPTREVLQRTFLPDD